jgi:hypothetical protein
MSGPVCDAGTPDQEGSKFNLLARFPVVPGGAEGQLCDLAAERLRGFAGLNFIGKGRP